MEKRKEKTKNEIDDDCPSDNHKKIKGKKEVYAGPLCQVIGPIYLNENISVTDNKKCYKLDPIYKTARCLVCHKKYKTVNRILKHLWEHHSSWERAKRFCKTKHQKVQTLEIAQFLTILKIKARSS